MLLGLKVKPLLTTLSCKVISNQQSATSRIQIACHKYDPRGEANIQKL